MPVVAMPNMWPLSSNDTSAVGGSVERTCLTSLLPLVSPICSPSMKLTSSFTGLELQFPRCGRYIRKGAGASSDFIWKFGDALPEGEWRAGSRRYQGFLKDPRPSNSSDEAASTEGISAPIEANFSVGDNRGSSLKISAPLVAGSPCGTLRLRSRSSRRTPAQWQSC